MQFLPTLVTFGITLTIAMVINHKIARLAENRGRRIFIAGQVVQIFVFLVMNLIFLTVATYFKFI